MVVEYRDNKGCTMKRELETLLTMLRHQAVVAAYMRRVAHALLEAADIHDLSKFAPDEFPGFVYFSSIARMHAFGSPAYNKAMSDNNGVIELHYSRNSHHPEHHERGVKDMGLVDLVEMVADWQAASDVYGKTPFEDGLEILRERFELDPRHLYLIRLIRDAISAKSVTETPPDRR